MCGCGSDFNWEEFEKDVEDEAEDEADESIEVTEEFAIPVRIGEEVVIER